MAFETQKNNVVAKLSSFNAAVNACKVDGDDPHVTVVGPAQSQAFDLALNTPDSDSTDTAAINAKGNLNVALGQLHGQGGTYTLGTGTNPATGAPTGTVNFTN